MKKILITLALILSTPTVAAGCTKGSSEMMEAYAAMVNLNGELCGELLEICSTTKKDSYLLHCRFSRDPRITESGMYLYNTKTGKVAKNSSDFSGAGR